MDDFEMYASGWMHPDEQAQWDRVTEMMVEAGEYDGKARDDLYLPYDDADYYDGEEAPLSGDIEF